MRNCAIGNQKGMILSNCNLRFSNGSGVGMIYAPRALHRDAICWISCTGNDDENLQYHHNLAINQTFD